LAPVEGKLHMRCEHCASLWFPPESDEGVRTLGESAEYDCPVCTKPLVGAEVEERPVAYCSSCRGILVQSRDLFEILNVRRMRGMEPDPRQTIDRSELSRLLACPACRKTMSAHPYYGPGNAIVDACGDCLLVWLDHFELSAIRTARR
jgi:Zn-finger nucleic acid-binding protein